MGYRATFDALVRESLVTKEGVLISMTGEISMVAGPFEGEFLKTLLCTNGSEYFQMVPCLVGKWKDKFEIWCDDESLINNVGVNSLATELLGDQVYGGRLHGPVLFVRSGIIQ